MSADTRVRQAGGKYRLLACDLDGTLLANHSGISARAMRALKRARDAGLIVVISTGRALEMIPKKIQRSSSVDVMITSNGARVVLRGGEALSVRSIPQQTAVDTILRLKEQGAAVNLFFNGRALFDRDVMRAVAKSGERLSLKKIDVFLHFLIRSRTAEGLCRRIMEKETAVEKIGGLLEDEEAVLRTLSRIEREASLTAVTTTGTDIEITAAGVDKGSALRLLCDVFHVKRDQVIVCGDSGNDLSMRGYCALFVAPDNAAKSVLEAADVITDGVEKDGVAKWISERFQ